MKTLLNTLYITQSAAYARLEGDTVCVELDRKKVLQVPLHHIGSIVCFDDTTVTPALMSRCATDGKAISFLRHNGEFAARVEGPVSGNVLLRLDQFSAYTDSDSSILIARNIVAGKIQNSRQIILRGARECEDDKERACLTRSSDLLAALVRKLESATELDSIRGIEGEAARQYFGVLNLLVRVDQRDDFQMSGRSRRPPLDRFNSILSFLYILLTHDCRAATESVGLDSQIGFLHSVRPGRPALALDLAEEFRSILADRVALTAINRLQVKADDFEFRAGGAVTMTKGCKKTIISIYQKRKQEKIIHPLIEDQIPLGVIVHLQARILARTIRGDMDMYLPFLYR